MADDGRRLVEQVLLGVAGHQVALVRVCPVLGLPADGGVADVEDLGIARGEVPAGQGADGHAREEARGPDGAPLLEAVGIPGVHAGRNGLARPEIADGVELVLLLFADGQPGAHGVTVVEPVFAAQPEVAAVELVIEPVVAVLRPHARAEEAGAEVAHDEFEVLDAAGHARADVVGGAGPLDVGWHEEVLAVRLGDVDGPLGVDRDDPVPDEFPHPADPFGHRSALVHHAPLFLQPRSPA